MGKPPFGKRILEPADGARAVFWHKFGTMGARGRSPIVPKLCKICGQFGPVGPDVVGKHEVEATTVGTQAVGLDVVGKHGVGAVTVGTHAVGPDVVGKHEVGAAPVSTQA